MVTLSEEESLALVEEGLDKMHFRHLPVVTGKKLVGLVTHRDILRFSASPLDAASTLHEDNRLEYTYVRDVMHRDPVTVQEETPLVTAAKRMRADKLSCIPVVDDEGCLVGIVTVTDLLDLSIEFLGG